MQRASSDRAELWYLRGRKIKEKKQITFKHAKQCTLRAYTSVKRVIMLIDLYLLVYRM